jgi:hypothetical protein
MWGRVCAGVLLWCCFVACCACCCFVVLLSGCFVQLFCCCLFVVVVSCSCFAVAYVVVLLLLVVRLWCGVMWCWSIGAKWSLPPDGSHTRPSHSIWYPICNATFRPVVACTGLPQDEVYEFCTAGVMPLSPSCCL